MKSKANKAMAIFMCLAVLWSQQVSIGLGQTNPSNMQPPSLDQAAKFSSQQIKNIAEKFNFDKNKIDEKRKEIAKMVETEKENFKKAEKTAKKKTEENEKKLKKIPQTVTDPKALAERQQIRCENVDIKNELNKVFFASLEKQTALDVASSRLMLLRNWKETKSEIEKQVSAGTISQRHFGNVLDIGSRSSEAPFKDQEKDLKLGDNAIKEAKATGEFPEEIKDPAITEYINRLAQNIAHNSDLIVPLKVIAVRKTEERDGRPVFDKDGHKQEVANAMALPGGYLVVFAGIVLESQSEAELAGVLAHEIAHAAARHGHRIVSRANKFSIAEYAGIIAISLFCPGCFYGLTGLLLQNALNGLGLIFAINILGISRGFELEADQLGIQYAWHAGYDPGGFISLFDRMSEEHGYASHTSFFATHPAFGERIFEASKEEEALRSIDPKREYTNNTSEFEGIKERVRQLTEITYAEEAKNPDDHRPSLYNKEKKEEEACKNILPNAPPLSSVKSVPNTPPVISTPQAEETAQPQPEPDEKDKPPVLRRKE